MEKWKANKEEIKKALSIAIKESLEQFSKEELKELPWFNVKNYKD